MVINDCFDLLYVFTDEVWCWAGELRRPSIDSMTDSIWTPLIDDYCDYWIIEIVEIIVLQFELHLHFHKQAIV